MAILGHLLDLEPLPILQVHPLISGRREPLADITTTDREFKVILEMPGVNKENIKINASDNSVEVKVNPQRKYHRVIEVPPEAED